MTEVKLRCNSEDYTLPFHNHFAALLPFRELRNERQKLRSYSQRGPKEPAAKPTIKIQPRCNVIASPEPNYLEKFKDVESQWNSVKSALSCTTACTPLRTKNKRGSYNFAIPEEEKSPFNDSRNEFVEIMDNPYEDSRAERLPVKTQRTAKKCEYLRQNTKLENKKKTYEK